MWTYKYLLLQALFSSLCNSNYNIWGNVSVCRSFCEMYSNPACLLCQRIVPMRETCHSVNPRYIVIYHTVLTQLYSQTYCELSLPSHVLLVATKGRCSLVKGWINLHFNCCNETDKFILGPPVHTTPEELKKLRFQNVFHRKKKNRHFQIPPVWRAFSKSSVFVTDQSGR